jgi:hypothetical protein
MSRPSGPPATALWRVVGWVYVPGVAALAAIWRVAGGYGIPFGDLSRDPHATFRAPVFIGILSNIGILGWAASATASLLACWTLRRARPHIARFLGGAGALSTLLLLDDFFMLHERVIHAYLTQSEPLMYAVYALLAWALLARFHRTILQETDAALLAAALGWFGVSLGVDLLIPHNSSTLEDSPKLLGIITWTLYFVGTSARQLRAATREPS